MHGTISSYSIYISLTEIRGTVEHVGKGGKKKWFVKIWTHTFAASLNNTVYNN